MSTFWLFLFTFVYFCRNMSKTMMLYCIVTYQKMVQQWEKITGARHGFKQDRKKISLRSSIIDFVLVIYHILTFLLDSWFLIMVWALLDKIEHHRGPKRPYLILSSSRRATISAMTKKVENLFWFRFSKWNWLLRSRWLGWKIN